MTHTNSAGESLPGSARSDDLGNGQLGEDDTEQVIQPDGRADAAGIDQVPSAPAAHDGADQNAPLPDGGPTDGTHGVDDAEPSD